MRKIDEDKRNERIKIIEKIEQYERDGIFDEDVENDPPTFELMPEDVDYLSEKRTSKIKNKTAYKVGERYVDRLLKNNKLIIKNINGIENLQDMETGAVITCNHFNPFDSFAIETIFKDTPKLKKRKLYTVIREGNYTNFSGLYGFFFRNAYTLPLSSNSKTMQEFVKAVDVILKRNEFVLIYPEQSMWWNYRKPKPVLKDGAYRLAQRSNVPVIPIFITMEDSDILGNDGFPIQEYTINISNPIYPDESLNKKECCEKMKKENFKVWKDIYENFYGIKLQYSTISDAKNEEK